MPLPLFLLCLFTLCLLAAGPAPAQTTFLGVSCPDGEFANGVPVNGIVSGTAAERIGLATGDRVTAIEGRTVRSYDELKGEVIRRTAGEAVILSLQRGEGMRLAVPVLGWEERRDEVPVPEPVSLARALEDLATRSGRALIARDSGTCREAARALEEAIAAHLDRAAVALDEVAARELRDRAANAALTARWFAERADLPLPVVRGGAEEGGDGVPWPVGLEILATSGDREGRFAVQEGSLARSDRTIRALLVRAGEPAGTVEARLVGRDRVEVASGDLQAGDRLEWVEVVAREE
ncbi:MAG: PDZ domain-containing protein [Planctomycetes bacterium]|nr:PDZ domain-containing protein [Planctomycetota bacterium]